MLQSSIPLIHQAAPDQRRADPPAPHVLIRTKRAHIVGTIESVDADCSKRVWEVSSMADTWGG